ncbi:MAG: Do family serine endopeptidase [Spirochaetales bacterium]|nr:Do family serine endopeptidase [Spirochaetales bacterium]
MRASKRKFPAVLILAAGLMLLLGACEGRPLGGQEQSASEGETGESTPTGGSPESQSAPAPGTPAPGTLVRKEAPLEQPPQSLAELQSSFQRVAEAVTPVVVQLNVVQVVEQQAPQFTNPFEFFFGPGPQQNQPREFRRPGLGSGVLVHQDGNTVYVLTNNHVVGEADEISVVLHDQSTHKAKLVGKDPRMDLALVSFTSNQELQMASLGDSSTVRTGDWVLAVGNPLGLTSTVTAGIISAVGRTEGPASNISEFLQTDAAINPGNSGGALVNIRGQVVGINTWIASTTGSYIGFGFAVPINNAKRVVSELITKGRVEYGWLGVSIRDPLPATREDLELGEETGSLVFNLYDGSPAERGGLQVGDYITRVDGEAVEDTRELTRMVGGLSAGQRVEFELIRYGESRTLTVRVTERLSEDKLAQEVRNLWPGMVVIDAEDAPQFPVERGTAVVALAYEGTPAGVAGFRQGDVIVGIDGTQIGDMMEFYQALNSGSGEVRFRILRQGREITLGLVR